MDRQQVYALAIPYETDLLSVGRFTQEGHGLLAADVIGPGPALAGLACSPTAPASLAVVISPGRIYQTAFLDAASFGQITGGMPAGGLAADTNVNHQILKQGLLRDPATLALPAPSTSGTSVNYLIEVMFQEVDTTPSVLPFFNTANPAAPLAGPNGLGTTLPTVRGCQCLVQAKAGAATATGMQVTPAADAGWVGLYVVTVANGQSAITAGNIQTLAGAPFLNVTMMAMQSQFGTYAVDTSAIVNTITAAPMPAVTAYTTGFVLRVNPANTNTGPVTINLNGLGAISLKRPDGGTLMPGDLVATNVFDAVVKPGPVLQLLSWPKSGIDGRAATGIMGPSHSFAAADIGNNIERSNSGAAMIDTLPAGLASGTVITVFNGDSTALLAIGTGAPAGFTVNGQAGVNQTWMFLGPGQQATFYTDSVNWAALKCPARCKLQAPLTVFVAPSGSNSVNCGLTAGSPFADANHAYSWLQNTIDTGGYAITIAEAAGSYTQPLVFSGPLVAQSVPVNLTGTGAGSTLHSCTTANASTITTQDGASVTVNSMTISNAASGTTAALLGGGVGTQLNVGTGVAFGACQGFRILVILYASCLISGSYSETGNCTNGLGALTGGVIDYPFAVTVTMTGTPNYSGAYVSVSVGGIIFIPSTLVSFSGSATGTRYSVNDGSVFTAGGGANFLPGSIAGTTTSNGVYQ